MDKVTPGVVADIMEGRHPERPHVQVLSTSRLPIESQEWWRLLLSDGRWSYANVMLSTHLNDKASNGEITNNCIICLDHYDCIMVQDNTKVLIIHDLHVTKGRKLVGGMIGQPVLYDANKHPEQSTPAPQTSSGDMSQSRTLRQRASPTRTPSGDKVHFIVQLSPYKSSSWTICARVTNKSSINFWSKDWRNGKLFTVNLVDESSEILATGFNELCDKFYNVLEVNKMFFITRANLKLAKKQYTNVNNTYEMTFNNMTKVTPCQESAAVSTQFCFTKLDQLQHVKHNSIVDVIGVCKVASDMSAVTQCSTGKVLKKRDIQLLDNTNTEVRLTFWGSQAESFDGSTQPIVAVKRAKVSEFDGRSLSVSYTSCMQVDPDIPEAQVLKAWLKRGGNLSIPVNLSGKMEGAAGGPANYKTFAEAKFEKLGTTKADYYTVRASIMEIKNCIYKACPLKECSKMVVEINNGLYRCDKCKREHSSFKWWLLLQIRIADSTDRQWVTLFQETAEALIGTTAEELSSLLNNNPKQFQNVLDAPVLKMYEFKLRCKTEIYNDQQRWKNIVVAVTPINIQELNHRLMTEIKQVAGLS